MTINEINDIRKEYGFTYQQISQVSGVPIGTVQKVLGGVTKNPRIDTMEALQNAISRLQGQSFSPGKRKKEMGAADGAQEGADQYRRTRQMAGSECQNDYHRDGQEQGDLPAMVMESRPAYGAPAKGGITNKGTDTYALGNALEENTQNSICRWTRQERDALPQERRTELIDGVLYDMAASTSVHQIIALQVWNQIDDCIKEHHASCVAFAAPTDVTLDRDEWTVVEPDVFIVCDRDQITFKDIQGAPAFIMEVLSPSTKKKDQRIKLAKYITAGVQEYWMVDPDRRSIVVYDLRDNDTGNRSGGNPEAVSVTTQSSGEREQASASDPDAGSEMGEKDGDFVSIYGFSDKIPIRISAGKCVIDMGPIRQLLANLFPAIWGK